MSKEQQPSSNLEQQVANAAQQAACREKEAWKEASTYVTQKKDEAHAFVNKVEQEAENLKLKLQQKQDEAAKALEQAATLGSQESDIHAKAVASGRSPGFMDRMKAGFQSVKESLVGAKDEAHEQAAHGQNKMEQHGEGAKETYANVKQGAGEKMEDLGTRLASKGQQTQEEASMQRDEAIARKTELQSQEREREAAHEKAQELRQQQQQQQQVKPGVNAGDTGASWKETMATQAEKAAGAAADRAKELQVHTHRQLYSSSLTQTRPLLPSPIPTPTPSPHMKPTVPSTPGPHYGGGHKHDQYGRSGNHSHGHSDGSSGDGSKVVHTHDEPMYRVVLESLLPPESSASLAESISHPREPHAAASNMGDI